MKLLKGLGNKKYLNTYSKIHQIASAADKLASKINWNSSASRQKFLLSWMWPAKSSNFFFAAHGIGNRQHDDVQNDSLGTNLSQLNENENG